MFLFLFSRVALPAYRLVIRGCYILCTLQAAQPFYSGRHIHQFDQLTLNLSHQRDNSADQLTGYVLNPLGDEDISQSCAQFSNGFLGLILEAAGAIINPVQCLELTLKLPYQQQQILETFTLLIQLINQAE